ncbi:MAG: HAMP domain-containing histidine kinase [Liquorilactobacillus nagelii]|jgi:signal transduction histidine kinase|uniref:sensor histidine kinase n=1 Tax=Liquorilactobacillus nagelii TaxID=82688 RepID=UPI0024310D24|nr:HAMP domain-containing sensor histidine kinase [Liquorilactobacillus nagelii]MCI1634176.1 HAMP domain-containing histidine kinase [Liquorilactobacillus nagelii]MCI1921383.1 HAMP domain-containing histidine kinase [Liquorilactobacillus nagelii]MCI1977517.1 HAMP domain-containing histidine kinase [Liquorilactobacillus nagelii]
MRTHLKKNQNSDSIMLRSFLLLLTVVIVGFSIITSVAVGHQLLETSRTTSNNIIKSLKRTVIDSDHDWKQWRFNSLLDTSTSYVRVRNTRRHITTQNYYSPGTRSLLKIKPQKIFFIHGLYYRPHVGFLLYNTGHAKGISYGLWTKLNSQLEILERVIIITAVVLVLILLTLPLYIRVIAQRLTGPLSQLTKTAETISIKKIQTVDKLPVPETPTEVKNLALSFNRLLTNLYSKTKKEKDFVANAAHELRTPIATIRSHVQLIKRHGRDHPEIVQDSLHYIYKESEQMSILIDDLLALSRADKMTLIYHNYDLSASLQQIAQEIAQLAPQKIITRIPAQVKITGHSKSISQIIIILLTNASKYSAKDSVIELSLKKEADQIIIQVADHGIGVAAQDKKHIFERFYRASDVRGTIAGTGLGLAIAQQLSLLNHFQLTVEDNHPQGSIFSLILNL